MSISYEYSIGSVRAKEKSLLNSSDIEQLLASPDVKRVCAFLTDKGYGDGNTVDEIIDSHMDSVWAYLKSVAPDFDIFRIFTIQNDVHNFKAILKCTLSDRNPDGLIMSPYNIGPDTIREAVENSKPSLLPEWLGESADKSYETLAHTGDARLADAIVDKAVMKETKRLAKDLRSEFIRDYFNNQIFYNDIKIAIRASPTKAGKDNLVKALCEVDGLDRRPLIDWTLKGYDKLIEELSKKREYDCDKAIEQFKTSPSAFEKFVDDRLIGMAKESCKRASEGMEPLLGYYLGTEAEKKVIHIIASGIRTGSDREIIRERLREIYG
jgi:V/A-type H+-transporting ATPase subunit C